jgi:hypothetical protein
VDIFATAGDGTAALNTLQRFTDTAAFDANLTGAFTLLATAEAGTAFRGVAFAPSVVPEPGSLLLGGAASVGLAALTARRSRRRQAAAAKMCSASLCTKD